MDNDVIARRSRSNLRARGRLRNLKDEILRRVYPEREDEILRPEKSGLRMTESEGL